MQCYQQQRRAVAGERRRRREALVWVSTEVIYRRWRRGTVDGSLSFNIPSHSHQACDPLTLTQREESLVSDHLLLAHHVFITLNHALRRHRLEQERYRCACFLRHAQRLIDLRGTQSAALLVIVHRER